MSLPELEKLMESWRKLYDEREAATTDLQRQLAEAVAPFVEQMAELESQMKALVVPMATTCKAPHLGVECSFRKGYTRVSYDSGKTDMVLGVLRDILPETAATLEGARKASTVAPSVSIKAIDKLPF